MPQPRYSQIDLDAACFYHCIGRCVRRAWLCGLDHLTGRNFDHRKAWFVEKLAELADAFGISICAYAVLSNHFHIVLRVDSARARAWSEAEVVARYGRVFPWAAAGWEELPRTVAADRVARWRARLYDPSWFMRSLNESIARRANAEDGCKGRFWEEGRFRSQALVDAAGLLTCMSYVDLNPIRANMASSLEESDFTSIQQRLELAAATACGQPAGSGSTPAANGDSEGSADGSPMGQDGDGEGALGGEDDGAGQVEAVARRPELVAFHAPGVGGEADTLPLALDDYVELLEATGAAVRGPAREVALPAGSVRSLGRLGINSEHWIEAVRDYRRRFFSMVGSVHEIDVYCARTDRQRAKGRAWAGRVFRDCA